MLNKEILIEKIISYFEQESTVKFTMDQIASSLKMSKKTLYRFFAGKDELVQAVIWIKINRVKNRVNQIISDDKNAVLKFNELTTFLLTSGLKFFVVFLDEMADMGPEWWEKIEKFRHKILNTNITVILEQGQREKLIVDKDPDIIRELYLTTIKGLINPTALKRIEKPIQTVISTVLEVLFRGILTEEGMKIYNKINQENKNEA